MGNLHHEQKQMVPHFNDEIPPLPGGKLWEGMSQILVRDLVPNTDNERENVSQQPCKPIPHRKGNGLHEANQSPYDKINNEMSD